MVAVTTIDKILRYCLIFEIAATLAVLILTAALSAWFTTGDPSWPHPPNKLNLNLAIAVITLITFIAMSLTKHLKTTWWEKLDQPKYSWPRLGIHALFFLLWLIASGTAFYSCDDLCGPVAGLGYSLTWYGKDCQCSYSGYNKRDPIPKYSSGYHSSSSSGGRGHSSTYEAMQAFDFLLMFCFLATTGLIFYRWHLGHRAPVNVQAMQEQGAAGAQPEDGAAAAGQLNEEPKHDTAGQVYGEQQYHAEQPRHDGTGQVYGQPQYQTEQPQHEGTYQGT